MTPTEGRRLVGPSAARNSVLTYQTAAWRVPGTTRFDSRPANDFLARADFIAPDPVPARPVEAQAEAQALPRWIIVTLGAGVAAVTGALMGGALSL
ncbi:hypothetical protein [Brevundimonas sp. R86498]|uniref:hypothetical protein n=1 Tax=Brevundimonas sp. R86498 TaxID=3093845 RepID=UPI0037CBB6A7